MSNVERLNNFLQRVTSDVNLTTSHVSVCTALYAVWAANGFRNPFNTSRRQLMNAAKIKSKTTYHKIISDLTALNYISYDPSYHPARGSEVSIFCQEKPRGIHPCTAIKQVGN
jgi:hypothetical protein